MSEEYEYIDTEMITTANEKIDFKTILFRSIETVRVSRVPEMAEYILFDLKGEISSEEMNKMIMNISKYQNAVKSVMLLLTNYENPKYLEKIQKIKRKYKDKKQNIIDKKEKQTRYYNKNKLPAEFYLWKQNKLKELTLRYGVLEYDDIFRECMRLGLNSGIIGGNDYIEDIII